MTGTKNTDDSTAGADAVPPGWLPECWHNPFTRALGLPPELEERVGILDKRPEFDPSERGLPHGQRRYCVLRIFDLMVPIARQVQLVERINMIIRQGYKSRDPSKGLHKAAFLASARAIERFGTREEYRSGEEAEPVVPIGGVPVSFALVGDPGQGKTVSTSNALAAIPQKVLPQTAYHVVQVVHLRVDCPTSSGRRQFCLNAVTALDEILGTTYVKDLGNPRLPVEYLMLQLSHLMTLHAVGLLVVDEIQHLLTVKEGSKPLLNFLVTIQNTLGVPVMLIGTNEARPLLGKAFRQARRAAGLGQPNWHRMREDDEWADWLEEVWRYQWTAIETPLTQDISTTVYDESQGILDVAIKLFVLAQLRAIELGEIRGEPETITPELLRKVAADEFGCIEPMIRALRDGREEVLREIPDLVPLQQHVDRLLSDATKMGLDELKHLRELRRLTSEAEQDARKAPYAAIRANLIARGHSEQDVDRAIAKALRSHEADDFFGITDFVRDQLAAKQPSTRRSSRKKNPSGKPPADGLVALAEGQADPVAALKRAGIVKTPDEILNE